MELEAAENSRKKFLCEATCPICLSFFINPVILDCGHSFCQACVLRCLKDSGKKPTCPQCRKTVTRKFKPNRSLSNLVEILGEWDVSVAEEIKEKALHCKEHQQPVTLFCKDDRATLCAECGKSQEHNGHTLISAEKAAQEYKNEIRKSLEDLEKEKKKVLTYKKRMEYMQRYLCSVTSGNKREVTGEFTELRQFAEAQEKFLQGGMEEVEKELTRKKEEQSARISRELASLEMLIQEMEQKSQLTAHKLLQDDRSIMQRYEERQVIETPEVYPNELQWKVWDFCDITPCLNAFVKQFKENLGPGLSMWKVNVTLDRETAHPQLVVSDNLQCVRYGENCQELPDNPKRFDNLTAVLGREEFVTGRHTWEVSVGTEGNWAIGVAKKSVLRKGQVSISSGNMIWVMGKWDGQYKIKGRFRFHVPPSGDPTRIRVILNCYGRRMAFYDGDRAGSITAFCITSVPGEVLVPFFWLGEKARLSISA